MSPFAPAPVPLRRQTPLYSTTPAYNGLSKVTCEMCGWVTVIDGRFAAPTMSSHGRVLGDADPTVPACPSVHQAIGQAA